MRKSRNQGLQNSPKISRRAVLNGGAALAVSTVLPTAALRPNQNRAARKSNLTELKISVSALLCRSEFAAKTLAHTVGSIAERVSQASAGTLRLVSVADPDREFGLIGDILSGTVDMGVHSTSLRWGLPPGSAFFGGLSFGLSPDQKRQWMTSESGRRLWAKVYEPAGLHPLLLACGNGSFGQVVRRPLTKIADFQNLRVFAHDDRSHWFTALGAIGSSVNLNPTAAVEQLKRGELDLTEPLAHSVNQKLGLHKLNLPYVLNPWFRSCHSYEVVVSTQAWASLSSDLRHVLESSIRTEGDRLQSSLIEREMVALRQIEAEMNQPALEFPEEVLAHFRRAAHDMHSRFAKRDPLFREIFASHSAFEKTLS